VTCACEPDFLKTQTKHGNLAKFACYVRGMNLTHPFSYNVELGYIDRWPKLPEDTYNRMLQNQRESMRADPQVIQKSQSSIPSEPKAYVTKPSLSATKTTESEPTPAAIPKPIAPQPTPNTDPDHGEAGEPANKW
jgi:hypothetical protein